MTTQLTATHVERPYPKGKIIVTRTDLNGVITHVSDDFAELSGFKREELVGNKHDVMRHPDMPNAVFEDLWRTVKTNRPWRGVIKNRCKNGDHYWVKIMVVPLRNQHRTLGYLFVRTEPTRDEINAADHLYRDIREKRRGLHKSTGLLASLLQRASFNLRLALYSACTAGLTVAAAAAGLAGWKELTWAICAAAVMLCAAGAYFIMYTVSRPINQAFEYFEQIAQGNLDNEIELDALDEAGRVLAALAATQTHLRVIIDEIQRSVLVLEQRCAELEAEMQQVSAHSHAQTDRIAQVSVAMDQVSRSVKEVAESADGTAQAAQSTQKAVDEGNQHMLQSIDNSDQVVTAVHSSSEGIHQLSESIHKVGAVTQMIKEIADQTNLLALNAAIEAARAGEQGRGFAVVADEVRKLAERTTRSTEEIDRMVSEIQGVSESAVEAMRIAAKRVGEGRSLIGEASASFKKITEASTQVTLMSNNIAAATKEQSAATDNVAKSTEHMSELIERNTASLQQVEQSVDGLRKAAGQLHDLVAHFIT